MFIVVWWNSNTSEVREILNPNPVDRIQLYIFAEANMHKYARMHTRTKTQIDTDRLPKAC